MNDPMPKRDDKIATTKSSLVRVLSQVRWPLLSGFDVDKAADAVAEQIGSYYPIRGKAQETQFLLTPEGTTPQAGNTLHTFTSGDGYWAVTLAQTFVTLETTQYTSHEDFIRRLTTVVNSVKSHLPFQRWERFGYRYTNRIDDEKDIEELDGLFDSRLLSTVTLDYSGQLLHHVSETVYKSEETSLLVKTALLPAGAMIEPGIAPVNQKSWILDLDAFIDAPSNSFDESEIVQTATTLSLTAHDFFEKVVTNEFRSRFSA